MSNKKKRVILIDEEQYPMDNLTVKISLPVLAKLVKDERAHAQKECISNLRPFISGAHGRSRLADLELEFEIQEEEVLVEEEVDTTQEYYLIDTERNEIIDNVDALQIIQTVFRNK